MPEDARYALCEFASILLFRFRLFVLRKYNIAETYAGLIDCFAFRDVSSIWLANVGSEALKCIDRRTTGTSATIQIKAS